MVECKSKHFKEFSYTKASIIILFLLLKIGVVRAQTPEIDSLRIIFQNNVLEDTELADFTINLGKKIFSASIDSAVVYGNYALTLSNKINYERGLAESNFLLGRAYNSLNEFDKSNKYLKEAETLFLNLNAFDRLGSLYNNLGIFNKENGDFKEALNYFILCKEYYELSNNTLGESTALVNLGIIYYRQAFFQVATEHYLDAIEKKEIIHDDYGIALIHANLGNMFRDQKEYIKSQDYFMQAKEAFIAMEDDVNLAKVNVALGKTYQMLGKINQATLSYKNGLEFFEKTENHLEIGNSYSYIGSLLEHTNDLDSALVMLKKAVDEYEIIENRDGLGMAHCEMGFILLKIDRPDEAKKLFLKGLSIAKDIGEKQIEFTAYQGLYEYFQDIGDLQQSFNYFKRYKLLGDTINNNKSKLQVAFLTTSFNFEKQQKENARLREKNVLSEANLTKKKFENRVLIVAIVLFFIFGVYFYRVSQQKKRSNELLSLRNDEINKKQAQIISINQSLTNSQKQLHVANKELQKLNIGLESTVNERTAALENLNKELDTFLYQSSHALRRPVVSVMGLTALARMEEVYKNNELTHLFDKIDDTLVRMDLMLKKLAMASEINFIKLNYDQINFEEIVSGIKENLIEKLKIEKINFDCEVPGKLHYVSDIRLIMVIFQNLIENAMLYHDDSLNRLPSIQVTVQTAQDKLTIKIHDNGIGIPTNIISSIFNMFTVGNEKAQGYGLGLYLVRKAVDKLSGKIQVDSKNQQYTTFVITLPANPMQNLIKEKAQLEAINFT